MQQVATQFLKRVGLGEESVVLDICENLPDVLFGAPAGDDNRHPRRRRAETRGKAHRVHSAEVDVKEYGPEGACAAARHGKGGGGAVRSVR